MRLDYTSASTLTESSILYTHGQTDTWTNKQTNRLFPVYTQKNLFCRGMIIQNRQIPKIKKRKVSKDFDSVENIVGEKKKYCGGK